MLSIIKFELAHNKSLLIKYIFLLFVLWLSGIIAPYISGQYIDFLLSKMQVDVLIAFILIIAVINIS